MKVKKVLKLLKEDSWYFVRQKGSHRQFKHPVKTGTTTVSGKLSDDLPIGTLHRISKQSKIDFK